VSIDDAAVLCFATSFELKKRKLIAGKTREEDGVATNAESHGSELGLRFPIATQTP
jgi:hypothetical protein